MKTFNYQALTKDEELLTGQVTAASAAAALGELESQGLTVLLIRQADGYEPARPQAPIEKVEFVPGAGQEILKQRLEQLLQQRVILTPALNAFAQELPAGPARRDLQRFAKRLQGGATAEELLHSPDLISVWLPLVSSGDLLDAGHLQEVFAQAEREYSNRAQMKRALAYPTVVFVLSLLLLVFLGIWIIPHFEAIFHDFELDLPNMTLLIIGVSRALRFSSVGFILGVVAAYSAFVLILRALSKWILPGRWLGRFLDGNTPQVAEMALFVQHLKQAINAGLPLTDALQLVGGTCSHRWLRKETFRLSNELVSDPIRVNLLATSALPSTVSYALQAGPEGAPNVALLGAIAENYFERVRNRFQWSTGFLPQFALIVVGFIVGFVVLGLFIPLVELINGLTG